eukprot:19399-Heterococcus_DN1.PRE.1
MNLTAVMLRAAPQASVAICIMQCSVLSCIKQKASPDLTNGRTLGNLRALTDTMATRALCLRACRNAATRQLASRALSISAIRAICPVLSAHRSPALRSSDAAWRRTSAALTRRHFAGNAGAPEYVVVNMPALSPTMEVGTITKWSVEPGTALAPGDVLCEVETDKATVSFEVQEDGVLAKVLVLAGGGE